MKTSLKPIWLLLIISNINSVHKIYSQNIVIDSLEQVLLTELNDTSRAKTLFLLCAEYRFHDLKKAIAYGEQATNVLQKYPDKIDLNIIAHYQLGVVYFFSGDIENAERASDIVIALCQQHDRKRKEMIAYGLVGGIYKRKQIPFKLLEINQRTLELARALQDTSAISTAYNNIALAYKDQQNLNAANKYAILALEMSESVNDTLSIAYSLYTLAITIENLDERIDITNRYLAISEKLGHTDLLSNAYTLKGAYFEEKQAYETAIPFFKKSLNYSLSLGDANNISINYNYLALCYLKSNQLDSVINNARQALQYAQPANILSSQKDANQYLASYFELQNLHDSAYHYLNLAYGLRDSIYNQQLEKQLADADAQFENEQARTEIAQQKLEIAEQKSFTNRIITGALFLLLLSTAIFQWYFFRQRRKKREAEVALQMQQLEAKKLKELDQSKSRFFANLSHELRTPLTLILGPLKNIITSNKADKHTKDLQLAHSNGEKLLSLVNEIMDLSKLESGQLQLYPTAVALIPFLKRIFYAYESAATNRRIHLLFESSLEEDLFIKLDQAKVEKVLNNLLSNALKFSSSGDEILMTVEERPGQLSIKIIDSGIGIAEQELPHLFNRFYQASQPMEQLSGGTGIGLALAKELAHLHNGDILVESQLGMGSTFTLLLPFQESVAPAVSIVSEDTGINIQNPYLATTYQPFLLNGEKARILIVEDNIEMSNFLQQILSPYFFCQAAMDGQQGLQLLHKSKIDLIISDVMMPNMDGFTFREKVSEMSAFQDLPFIMLTARADDQDRIKGLLLGVNDYISKPFSTQELIARIHNLLKNRQSRQAIVQEPDEVSIATDERFIKEAEAIVLKHLDEVDFKVSDLAKALNYSQRQLARVLKKYTGLSSVEFILEIRLQKAYQLIQQQRYLSVSEIRYDVGIESASYFSKKFAERFGEAPSNLLKK